MSAIRSTPFSMELKIFEIAEVARLLNMEPKKKSGDEWFYRCPFCGDSKKDPDKARFSVNIQKQIFHCFNCGKDGNALTLYGDLIRITYSEAYRQLSENPEVRNILYESVAVETPRARRTVEGDIAEYRDIIYREFLSMLPLYDKHRNDLIRRKLPEEVIKKNHYKSVPNDGPERWKIARVLSQKYDLTQVPGFFQREGKKGLYWDFYAQEGYFIPVLNPKKQIIAMQIRVDDESKGKYKWFSTSKGAGSGSPIHCRIGDDPTTVYLTEGPLKLDIAHFFSGRTMIANGGVAIINEIPEVLKEIGAKKVVIAYDIDRMDNPGVKKATRKLVDLLTGHGFKVYKAYWSVHAGKGIDDALVNRAKITTLAM